MLSQSFSKINIDGKSYEFSPNAMKALCNLAAKAEKKQLSDIIKDLAIITHTSVRGVRKWLNGDNGPDKEKIAEIAKALGGEMMDLLSECDKEEKEVKDNVLVIKEDEKKIQRMVYSKMCDLINHIDDWQPFDPNVPDLPIKRPLREECQKGWTKEQLRNDYLLTIKKASLDLPQNMRNQLEDLVDDIFGPFDLDGTKDGFFEGEIYHDYLKRNKWKDVDESRYKFCAWFSIEANRRLDKIFENYLCK